MKFTIVAYFVMHEMTAEMFVSLGVSATMIYPLAFTKALGLVAIWSKKPRLLKELAYLGFALELLLAATLHTMASDGGAIGPLMSLFVMLISYFYHLKLTVMNARISATSMPRDKMVN